jgi:hypothetical protein
MTVIHSVGRYQVCDLQNLVALFHDTFYKTYNTELSGGYDQPQYIPADKDNSVHRLQFREDYIASAFHEIAHWCIAGNKRHLLVDFGYWYHPDGRSETEQKEFEKVEVKPQALEWIFSVGAGCRFQLSTDNLLSKNNRTNGEFADRVYQQVLEFCNRGLPERANQFVQALSRAYGLESPLSPDRYKRHFL